MFNVDTVEQSRDVSNTTFSFFIVETDNFKKKDKELTR